MQRLKKIHQYGVSHYVLPQKIYRNTYNKKWENKDYNRFDHSIGVFFLLKKYGASLREQISGLLHNVSHTVFSHVGDFLNAKYENDGSAYQDKIFMQFIKNSEISQILQRYKIKLSLIAPEDKNYVLLEQELPNICTDRLEYTLQGRYIKELLTKNEISEILNNLTFCKKIKSWYFSSEVPALKLANTSLEITKKVSAPAWNTLIYRWTAEALKEAVSLKIISEKDIETGTDDVTWQKLQRINKYKIKNLMEQTTKVLEMI